MTKEILSLGSMYVDINVKDFPIGEGLLPNSESVGKDYETVPGGSALNFALICAALELKTVFIGKTGKDSLGKLLKDMVQARGITSAFIESAEVQTNLSINLMSPEGTTIMAVAGSANSSLNAQEVLPQFRKHLPDVEYLYLGGCFKLRQLIPYLQEFAQAAKRHGAKVILDHGRITNEVTTEDKRIIQDLINQVDYYLPSINEFLTVWAARSIEEGFEKVRVRSSQVTVVVKDGQKGAIGLLKESDIVRIPAFQINVTNTVGAGDSFNAGFIRAQIDGLSLQESIRFANATAAVKISQSDLPTLAKVQKFLTTQLLFPFQKSPLAPSQTQQL